MCCVVVVDVGQQYADRVDPRQLPSIAVPLIDLDDLLSADEVAEVLGLAGHRAVSVYRARYSDFPTPVVVKGRCTLWLRADVKAWAESR